MGPISLGKPVAILDELQAIAEGILDIKAAPILYGVVRVHLDACLAELLFQCRQVRNKKSGMPLR